ncbi:protein of unknown function [Bartonella clarridgeiae 73]|uniref:Uncharacterized protein n=1 Tax=Bartonella clarridgeiae (strain CCUG 45776 / CIP 104772 / 73) TaxID=696125 RepID=E6YH72_BARC7|nr:protein of unknown function [Bartonella clarridgeiae 73]
MHFIVIRRALGKVDKDRENSIEKSRNVKIIEIYNRRIAKMHVYQR